MENNSGSFSPEQSLKLISEMISKTRNNFTNISYFFLLWGYLTMAGGVAEFILFNIYDNEYAFFVWPAIGISGGIAAFLFSRKSGKEAKAVSFLDKIFGYLWLAYAVALVLIIIGALESGLFPHSFIMLLTGMPTFFTGRALKFKPLMAGGILFWLLGILSFFIFSEYVSLIFSAAILFGYIIPGLMLQKQEKKNV